LVLSEKLMQWIVLVSLSGGSGGLGGPLQGVLGGLGMPGWGGCCIHQGGKASRRGQRLLHGPLQSQEEILCHEHELGNRKLSSGLRCRPGRQAQQAPRPPRPLDPWVGRAGALLSPVGAMLDASPAQQDQRHRRRNPSNCLRSCLLSFHLCSRFYLAKLKHLNLGLWNGGEISSG